ncbi:MAG: hypothetical protein K6T88_20240 [Bacillus sp. (in: Bacteria)]|nr:hypothetical protein [Bacillus sp. (in: firmicutes)]
MNEKWIKLIKQFEGEGYTPGEIQRIVWLYEMMKYQDEKSKDLFEDDENEHND